MLQNLYSKIKDYLYFIVFIALLIVFLSIPVFTNFNYFVLDRFQGQITARSEIVIIGIDDSSLQTIGAWPWNRDVFAKAIQNLDNSSPRVVAFDVLFLETRVGDNQFQQALDTAKFKTVMGVKAENNQVLKGKFGGRNVSQGLIDFQPDTDGKIRRIDLSRTVGNNCENSFGLEIFSKYLSVKNQKNCQDELTLRNNKFPNNLEFSYINGKFSQYSFLDLYQNKLSSEQLKDKIVIIGSTAKDLRSNLNDNFTSVFGSQITGVEIHTNLVNTLLNNKYQKFIPYWEIVSGISILAFLAFYFSKKVQKNWLELTIFFGLIILSNFAGFVVYNYGYNWYFFQINILLIFSYFYFLAHKYLVVSKQSRLIEKAFSKYVNPEILRTIIQNPEGLKLGGKKQVVTVLFSDIRGFTSFSERLSPEELIKLINSYLTTMTEIVLKNGGTVDKYIGDAIMAFWNAPVNQQNHQYLALKTSLEMQIALEKFNLEQTIPIKIGIGLNTGEVIVGNVGSENRFDYTILGDTVNLGSRLEGLTKKYGITTLVAIDTVTDLIDELNLIYRIVDEVRVKGKQNALKICQPLENTAENLQFKQEYEQAFKYYQQGDFNNAKTIFEKLQSKDIVSVKMLERIIEIETDFELQSNWIGVWNWLEK